MVHIGGGTIFSKGYTKCHSKGFQREKRTELFEWNNEYKTAAEEQEEINYIEFFTDGATVGYNGKLGTVKEVGIGVYCKELGIYHFELLDGLSNNEAEFKALIAAMKIATQRGVKCVRFNMDSQLTVNRARGRRPKGRDRNERMDKFQDEVLKLKENFEKVAFMWIPREQNTKADDLSKQVVALSIRFN